MQRNRSKTLSAFFIIIIVAAIRTKIRLLIVSPISFLSALATNLSMRSYWNKRQTLESEINPNLISQVKNHTRRHL